MALTPPQYKQMKQFLESDQRVTLEDGGMLVKPGFGGTRQGYRKDKTGFKQEVEKLSRWIEKNKDTFDFANSSSADVLKASKVNLGEEPFKNI